MSGPGWPIVIYGATECATDPDFIDQFTDSLARLVLNAAGLAEPISNLTNQNAEAYHVEPKFPN